MKPDIRPISAAATRPLRQRILRPHQAIDELVYPRDDHPLALHVGAFVADQLVGIASFAPESCPAAPAQAAWRLRGMGVLPAAQRQGLGKALLQAGIAHARRHAGDLIWCHGRTSALPFYRAQGFVTWGDEFVVPQTGPHYILLYWLTVPVPATTTCC
ncbi:GNAT family N-acetyltransferase [Chloroflexus sp.]|uniref:GNAT family N-acetyltransferase n=1 Tax=Chloroflexus sp. TaxID=1904827 RepID=UPI00262B0883|nr:GNAT family N-acetyltransferase [uncultured Chloroflexus sp.]